MIDKDELAAAVSENDKQVDGAEGDTSPLPALFTEMGIDPDAAFYVAEQRAYRVMAFAIGKDPAELTKEDIEEPKAKQFIGMMAATFLDGLAASRRLTNEERAEIRSLCERAYVNQGLDFDSVRKIGIIVEADEALL